MTQAALPTLRTPRLELRPLQDSDADAIVRGVGNFDVSKWLAVVPYPYDVSDAHSFLARVAAQDKPFWAICNAHGLKGIISLDDELAYWLARDAWGKGYGFEAAHAVVEHWFAEPQNAALTSGYFDGNDRSGALLSALGFRVKDRITRYAKSFRQDVISNQMTLTRADWQARHDFTLYTPRLTIRALGDADAEAFAALMREEVTRNLAVFPKSLSVDDARDAIKRRAWTGYAGFSLGIEYEGALIGFVGCGGSPISLAYALGCDHWGQGLATEALSAFLPALFDRFPAKTLLADHFEDNPASGAILCKFGFVQTGKDIGTSKARLEPAPVITYALARDSLRVPV